MNIVKQGDIWLVDLGETLGSEQRGLRPCVVVQNNVGNKFSPTTIICPITKQSKKFNVTHVLIPYLKIPSMVLCEQIRVVDKNRLTKKLTSIDNESIMKINDTIRKTLGMEVQ